MNNQININQLPNTWETTICHSIEESKRLVIHTCIDISGKLDSKFLIYLGNEQIQCLDMSKWNTLESVLHYYNNITNVELFEEHMPNTIYKWVLRDLM